MTVTAGLPRRLGLVLAPEPGESLASWIDRLGRDMRRPPGLVADDLDLRVVPTRCANRTGDRMCGYRLTELPRVPVNEEICAAQLAYLDAADGRPRPVAGRCIDAAEWGWAFRIICGLVRFVGQSLVEAMRPFGAAVVAGPGAAGCRSLWRWRMPPLVNVAVRAVFPAPMARWSRVGAHVPSPAGVDARRHGHLAGVGPRRRQAGRARVVAWSSGTCPGWRPRSITRS